MAEELLDAVESTTDDSRNSFESYEFHGTRTCNKTNDEHVHKFRMDNELRALRASLQEQRMDMELLDIRQIELIGRHDVNDIEELPSSGNGLGVADGNIIEKPDKEKIKTDHELVISCDSSPCLFEHCRKQIDNQLLLLHYHCDHNEEALATRRCHRLTEDEPIILSFDIRSCRFKQIHIIGLLEYVSNSDIKLRKEQLDHERLVGNVPIMAFICLTAPHAAQKDRLISHCNFAPANPNDQVYIIWLAMPYNFQQQLNAKLRLCGRDAANQASIHVGVCRVRQSQETRHIPVDDNYWRLSFVLMQKITNNFRDELQLEVALVPVGPST